MSTSGGLTDLNPSSTNAEPPSATASANSTFKPVAGMFAEVVLRQPHSLALIVGHGRDRAGRVSYAHVTYRQLDALSDRIANGLEQLGIKPGQRVVVMSQMQIDYYATIFALFKLGAVLAHIDAGMDPEIIEKIIDAIEPVGFFADPKIFALGALHNWGARTVKYRAIIGEAQVGGGDGASGAKAGATTTIDAIAARGGTAHRAPPPVAAPTDTAFLFTTSGSTGVAKPVVYTQLVMTTLAADLRLPGASEFYMSVYPFGPIFSLLSGMSVVLPPMDQTKPGEADPKAIIETIEDWGIGRLFVTPAFMATMARHNSKQPFELSSVDQVTWTGGPVMHQALARFRKLFPAKAKLSCQYGATEAITTAFADTDELLTDELRSAADAGKGLCIGRVPPNFRVRIIKIVDGPIEQWNDDLVAAPGEIGELVVSGPGVSPAYIGERANALAKIRDRNTPAGFWHRLGDVGYFDVEGRLWYGGRKDHRVATSTGTLFSVNCEAVFAVHPKVERTALVGVAHGKEQLPVICVELVEPASGVELETIRKELLEIGRKNPMTRPIEHVLFHSSFPVDPRHNAKIVREALALWASTELRAVTDSSSAR